MRITNIMMTDKAIQYINANQDRLYNLQEKNYSQKAFQQASDDPAVVSQALTLRSAVQASQDYLDTAQNVDNWMSATDDALGRLVSIGTQAATLVNSGLNDTLGTDERANSLAPQMSMLINNAIDAGNSSYAGNYLFAGFQVDTKPFELAEDGSAVQNLCTKNANIAEMKRDLGLGQTVTQNIDGKEQAFVDLYSALIDAQKALADNDSTALRAALSQIQTASDDMAQLYATNGARQKQVETVIDSSGTTQTELKNLLSKREDANMAEVISQLQNQQTTYQAVLEVSQRAISSLTLFDYLQ